MTEKRVYNETEQTMFIISDLNHDIRLRPGLKYVESVLQVYQRNSRFNTTIHFPLELHFDEIDVVLDEHSDDYTVGEQASDIHSTFNIYTVLLYYIIQKIPTV